MLSVGVLALGSDALSVPSLQPETRATVCSAERTQATPKGITL